MSVHWLNYVFTRSQATGAERLVLLVLADHADEHGTSYPGIARIAAHARLTKQHVKKTVRKLEQDGRIKRLINAAPDERIPANRRPNLYQILKEPLGGASDTPQDSGGSNRTLQGGADDTPKPSLEPPSTDSSEMTRDARESSPQTDDQAADEQPDLPYAQTGSPEQLATGIESIRAAKRALWGEP